MSRIVIDPISRIEGHLKIEVEVKDGKVVDAWAAGEMFRGFEQILKGRNPNDAQMITQRICGVCPASHAQAATLNLDDAYGIKPPHNGRVLRNVLLGANYIQSHILHFYHLAALDFVDITAILQYKGKDKRLQKVKAWAENELAHKNNVAAVGPFLPRYEGDYIKDVDLNIAAIDHYLQALDMRMKAHELFTVWGGKMPHGMGVVPGGATQQVTADKVATSIWRLKELQEFIDSVYIPDVVAVAKAYPEHFSTGVGCKNLLSYGVFEENSSGSKKLLAPGVFIDGKADDFDAKHINEHVEYSKFKSASGLHPADGATKPDYHKEGAYTWLKAPRYKDKAMEVGPLARMFVTHVLGKNPKVSKLVGDTLKAFNAKPDVLFSTLGRHAARALEAKVVADRMQDWLKELKPGKPVHTKFEIPRTGRGMGLTEAPRGALGHWVTVKDQKIDNYQCVVPTTWNAGPRDKNGVQGPIEQSLIGTPVPDVKNPLHVARIVRSFDPCIACAVHIIDEKENMGEYRIV
ncbi:MAG: nickel-dependent hydrogenase large subunit [Pseudomonadota bacterium]